MKLVIDNATGFSARDLGAIARRVLADVGIKTKRQIRFVPGKRHGSYGSRAAVLKAELEDETVTALCEGATLWIWIPKTVSMPELISTIRTAAIATRASRRGDLTPAQRWAVPTDRDRELAAKLKPPALLTRQPKRQKRRRK